MKFEIKNRWTNAVIFTAEIECSADQPLRIQLGLAIRKAYEAKAYLRGADLSGADLRGAYLRGAYLRGADLRGADLSGAYLRGADLRGADLRGAYLRGADLSGADLSGADLRGAQIRLGDGTETTLVGERPVLQIGPIGSRSDTLTAFITAGGVMVRTGCFGPAPLSTFAVAVTKEHGDSVHGDEYRAAIAMIEVHAKHWTPVTEDKAAAE